MEEIIEQFQKLNIGKSVHEDEYDFKIESRPNLEQVEKIIIYNFKNKELLQKAFTDHSCTKKSLKNSNERLEYIGDKILNCLMGIEQFNMYPEFSPGQLTALLSVNTSTEKLARAAVEHGLYRFLLHDKPRLDAQIEEFIKNLPNYPLSTVGLIDAPKTLADIIEAIIGAVFLDSNQCYKTTYEVIKKLLQPILTPTTLVRHPVTLLTETCQKNGLEFHDDDTWKTNGEIKYIVENKFVGIGKYKTKRTIARNRAAANAYDQIVKNLHVN